MGMFYPVDHTEKRKDAAAILYIPNRRLKSLKDECSFEVRDIPCEG
jgi:hypothetical protein